MKTRLLKSAVIAVLIAISTNVHAFTAVVSGPWSSTTTWGGIAPGSSVNNQDIIIPTGITVDLDIDVMFNGLVLNQFNVDGTLNSTTNNNVSINGGQFTGAGTVDIHRLTFNGLLTTSSFTGTLTLNSLQNQGSAITFSGSATVSDTLDLDSGSLILASGSNLSIATNGHVRVEAGTLTTTGGAFSAAGAYNVSYVGLTKTTGLEVNSGNLQHLFIILDDNAQILTLGLNNLVVNGILDMQTGQFDISNNHLTLMGDLDGGPGSMFTSNAATDLTIAGAGPMTNAMRFNAGSTVNTIEVNRTGSGKLGSALPVTGTVFLTNGDFILQGGGTLTMNAGSRIQIQNGNFVQNGGSFVGTASYDVDFIGSTHTTSVEVTGSGLNDVLVGLVSSNDTVILSDNVIINGNLDMSTGMLSLNANDLTLNATFDQNAAAVFVGDSASTMTLNLTSTGDTIYFGGINHLDELEINIPATTSILLASDLTIHGDLIFTNGKVEITNSDLSFRSVADITGFNDTRYIITSGSGQVEREVVTNSVFVTYPVGNSIEYAPAYLQQTPTGTTGLFKVRAMDNVYSQGTSGFDASSSESVVDKTWVIDAANAVVVNLNLTLGWLQTDEVNGFNRNQCYITKYNNNNWDSSPASAATPGPNNTYQTTRNGATSDGAFAVVDTSAILGLNDQVVITGISIYPNPTVDVVTVETGDAHTNYLYQIYDFTGKVIASASNANAVNKFDLTAYSNGFYFIKITNVETNATITKRIIKN